MFRELADQSVLLEGDSIAETYLNGAAIIQAAKETGEMRSTLDLDSFPSVQNSHKPSWMQV